MLNQYIKSIFSTKQLQRDRGAFPNVLFSNFYEFRLYREGTFINIVQITRPVISRNLKIPLLVENEIIKLEK